jgi:hypothetical protein
MATQQDDNDPMGDTFHHTHEIEPPAQSQRGEEKRRRPQARRYTSLDACDIRHPLANWRSRAAPTVARLVNLAKDEMVWALAPTPQNLGG